MPVTSFVVTLPFALIFVTVSSAFSVADFIVKLFIITSPPSCVVVMLLFLDSSEELTN